jgi:two-component system sensor histidine kinase YesM
LNINQDIKSFKIPKLILQPIVENAIVHGIENKVGEGKIEIKGFTDNGRIFLIVNDNGIGMDQSTAESLLSDKPVPETEGHTHIGLKNVNQRLKMYYGREYGIEIKSECGFGTSISVCAPVNTDYEK